MLGRHVEPFSSLSSSWLLPGIAVRCTLSAFRSSRRPIHVEREPRTRRVRWGLEFGECVVLRSSLRRPRSSPVRFSATSSGFIARSAKTCYRFRALLQIISPRSIPRSSVPQGSGCRGRVDLVLFFLRDVAGIGIDALLQACDEGERLERAAGLAPALGDEVELGVLVPVADHGLYAAGPWLYGDEGEVGVVRRGEVSGRSVGDFVGGDLLN